MSTRTYWVEFDDEHVAEYSANAIVEALIIIKLMMMASLFTIRRLKLKQ